MLNMPPVLARKVLDSAPMAVVILDAFDSIWFANRKLCAIFGLSISQLPGESIATLIPGYSIGVRAPADPAHRPNLFPFDMTIHVTGRHHDGGDLPLEVCVHPIEGAHPVLFTMIIRPSSRRERLEGELVVALAALDAMRELAESRN
jgi:protein-histidine pros-kinase